ncbi:MAG: ATP-dependent metallopeptidase FtsH/Yme1/Tma family protein, partial [Nitrospiraceae bacterium]
MDDKADYKKLIKEKMNNPQWRLGVVVVASFLVLFLWSITQNTGGPTRYAISYSEFFEQLSVNNIHSVTIKNLNIRGEFRGETDIYLSEGKQAVMVKSFKTALPSFQGENLLDRL